MTDEDGAVLTLFGHCRSAPGARSFCALCTYEYRNTYGVIHRCSCPCGHPHILKEPA